MNLELAQVVFGAVLCLGGFGLLGYGRGVRWVRRGERQGRVWGELAFPGSRPGWMITGLVLLGTGVTLVARAGL